MHHGLQLRLRYCVMPLMALDTWFTAEDTVVVERRLLPLLFPSLDARKGVKEDQGLGMLPKAFGPGRLALHPFMRYPEPYAVRNATRPHRGRCAVAGCTMICVEMGPAATCLCFVLLLIKWRLIGV